VQGQKNEGARTPTLIFASSNPKIQKEQAEYRHLLHMSSNDRTAEWLTEEWTIRPNETLPSLWEIAGVNAVEVAVTEAIQAAVHGVLLCWRYILDSLRRRLASSDTCNAARNVSLSTVSEEKDGDTVQEGQGQCCCQRRTPSQ
jgi:hypothetical protein